MPNIINPTAATQIHPLFIILYSCCLIARYRLQLEVEILAPYNIARGERVVVVKETEAGMTVNLQPVMRDNSTQTTSPSTSSMNTQTPPFSPVLMFSPSPVGSPPRYLPPPHPPPPLSLSFPPPPPPGTEKSTETNRPSLKLKARKHLVFQPDPPAPLTETATPPVDKAPPVDTPSTPPPPSPPQVLSEDEHWEVKCQLSNL